MTHRLGIQELKFVKKKNAAFQRRFWAEEPRRSASVFAKKGYLYRSTSLVARLVG